MPKHSAKIRTVILETTNGAKIGNLDKVADHSLNLIEKKQKKQLSSGATLNLNMDPNKLCFKSQYETRKTSF